jgi:hypothetical protein
MDEDEIRMYWIEEDGTAGLRAQIARQNNQFFVFGVIAPNDDEAKRIRDLFKTVHDALCAAGGTAAGHFPTADPPAYFG